jgi:hypothetical protein
MNYTFFYGELSEWFKELVLKTSEGLSLPWVRIPHSPPITVALER